METDLQSESTDSLDIIEREITLQSNKIKIVTNTLSDLICSRQKLIERANALRRLLGKPIIDTTGGNLNLKISSIEPTPTMFYSTWA